MNKGKRKNLFFFISIITFMLMLIYRIIMVSLIGSKGVAYFSVPMELFCVMGFGLSISIEQSLALLIENRINRQMYENAKRVFYAGIILSFVTGMILLAAIFTLKSVIIEAVFNMPYAGLPMIMMLPALPLYLVMGALRGYLKGNGIQKFVDISYIIFIIIFAAMGITFSILARNSGLKIAHLLRNENFGYVYGAIGTSLALIGATFVSFIFTLVMAILHSRRTNYNDGRDYLKSVETYPKMMMLVIKNSLPTFGIYGVLFLSYLINEIFILTQMDSERILEFSFGEYYGKSFSIIYIMVMMLIVMSYGNMRRTVSYAYREEYRSSRERLGRMIHRCSSVGLFISSMVIVFADNIVSALFSTNGKEVILYMECEGVCIVLFLFAVVFIKLLVMLKYTSLAAVLCSVSLVIHTILAFVLVVVCKMSITGIIIANAITYLLVGAIGFLIVTRFFQYTQEWYRTFAVSLITALVSGLIGMIINRTLAPLVGKLLSLFITALVCVVVFMITSLLLKGYNENELEESPLGRIMLWIGRNFGLI